MDSGRTRGEPAEAADPERLRRASPQVVARELLERVRRGEPTERHELVLANATHDDLAAVRSDTDAGLAFWLNVYNAAAQLLLERRPDLFDSTWRFFRADAIAVADVALSLDDIEHGVLRGERSKYGLGYLPRVFRADLPAAYRLECDPRIHFALNCGAASCPAILAYDADEVDDQLDAATRTHLDATVEYDPERDRVVVPRFCLWFIGDFGGPSGVREFLRRYGAVPEDAAPSVRFADYDWTRAPRAFRDGPT